MHTIYIYKFQNYYMDVYSKYNALNARTIHLSNNKMNNIC